MRVLAYYNDINIKHELLNFKNGYKTSIQRWWNFIDENFDFIFKDLKIDYIVRALSSKEKSHSNYTGLDLLGELLAQRFNAEYVNDIFSKPITKQLKSVGGAYNRQAVLSGKYRVDLSRLEKGKNFLVIDDVTTTGTTFNEIKRAILKEDSQAKVEEFALVKTLWDRDYSLEKRAYNQKFYKSLMA